ncbi:MULTISPECIES: hypothetical protein [unclassified Streptomyces]|uniref:hypothetical protein n=1 Tax=unclassified Streptomyces TaxID=2593676 RepID=UPI0034111276
MITVRPVAAYSLVLVSPTREERRTAPVATVAEAAERAAISLWLSGRASGDAAQEFAQMLTTLTEGETLRHAPSGFSARIEWAGQLTPPAPDAPLRITETITRPYGYAEDDTAQTVERAPRRVPAVLRHRSSH